MSVPAGGPASARAGGPLPARAGVRAAAEVPYAACGSPGSGCRGERGSALLVTMAAGALVSALAAALAAVVTMEEAVEANHRRGVQALYAADGLLAGVVAELSVVADGSAPPDGSGLSGFRAGPAAATLPDGSVVDAAAETRAMASAGGGPGAAGWRLFARGWFGDLVGAPDRVPRLYLLAWIRGDPADPAADAEGGAAGRLVVRAAAFGPFRVRRAVEATLVSDADGVRVVAWNVVR